MRTETELKPLSETVTRKVRHNPHDFEILRLQIKETKKTGVMHLHFQSGTLCVIELEEKESSK